MDALPIPRRAAPWPAGPGVMHACGHDGHTTMLLGAAQHLAEHAQLLRHACTWSSSRPRKAAAGAQRMIADGLFERFPCDAIFGMHNHPGVRGRHLPVRRGAVHVGVGLRATITIHGRGGHAARPHLTVDPVVIAGSISWRCSRSSRATSTRCRRRRHDRPLHAGTANNVIPERPRWS